MKTKTRNLLFGASVLLTFSALPATAATGIWTQTGAGPFDWGTGGNWSGATIADGADFTASFSSNITASQTINLDAARTIGNIVASDGSHDYTISGANILTLDRTNPAIPVINVTPSGRALTISSVINGNDGLDKRGAGQLILNGSAANGFTGGIKVSSGTLNLNFANLSTPTDLVNSGNALTLDGGTLLVTGNSATNTNQTLGNVTVNASGQILVNPTGASRTTTLTLGSITPATSASTLLLGKSSGSSGTAAITTTSGTLTNGIYGGHMVYFNGTANTGYDWATTTGGGPTYTVSGLGTYTTLPTSGGSSSVNYQMTAATTLGAGASFSVNTLKMAPGATASVALNLGGNTLTLEGGGLLFTGSGTGNIISNGTITAGAGSGYKLLVHSYNSQFNNTNTNNPGITAVIANNGPSNPVSLVITGNPGGSSGMFYLGNATNSFTGGLYLNNAAVNLKAGMGAINNNTIFVSGYSVIYDMDATANSTASQIQLGDGAVLDFRLNTRTFTTSGAVTGKGGVTLGQAGGGATNLNFNSASNNFSGPIEYRVTPNGQNGQLSVNSIGDAEVLGSGDIRFGVAGTGTNSHIFNFGGSAGSPAAALVLDKRRFELAGGLPLAQINNNSSRDFTINTDLLSTGTGTKTLTFGGTGSGISTFAGDITNGTITTLNVTKAGGAVWTLSGDNSFNGTLTLSGASAGSQLNINSATALGTGTFTISGGNNAKIDNTSGGTILNSNNNAMIWSNDFAFVGSNNLDLGDGAVTMGGNRGITVTAKTLSVGGAISGSGFGLTKSGNGTLVLGGDNAYTGATNVGSGSLIINGNTTLAIGAVTVSATGTLGGVGIVGGTTNLNGTLSPGQSPGTLTFAGDLNVNNGATYIFESGDLTQVNGALDLNDNWNLTLSGSGFQDGGSVVLFNYATLAIGPDLVPSFNFVGLGFTPGALTLTDTGSSIVLNGVSIVPEPNMAALLGSLVGLLLLRRRR